MKYLLLLFIAIPTLLFTQEWDNENWETLNLYENNQPMELNDIGIVDVKCFGNDNCIAVGLSNNYFLVVFKFNGFTNQWDLCYDGRWDPFSTPESEWPDIYEQAINAKIIDENYVSINYKTYGFINKFDWKNNIYDTIHFEPYYEITYIDFNPDGYGIATNGRDIFTTNNFWKSYNTNQIKFEKLTVLLNVTILPNNTFCLTSYDDGENNDGKTTFQYSNDGMNWNKSYIGELFPYRINFISDKVGFIVGVDHLTDLETGYDVIYKTIDGGQNWYQVLHQYNEPPSWGLYDIDFFDDNIGIASSKPGMIYTTTNQGESWEYNFLDEMVQSLEYMSSSVGDSKIYLLSRGNGIFSYDAGLLGITSVPFLNYKEIECYPNPFNNTININTDGVLSGLFKVKIFNSNSELVFEDTDYVSDGFQLNTDLPAGAYFLLLEGDEYYYKKIIKE